MSRKTSLLAFCASAVLAASAAAVHAQATPQKTTSPFTIQPVQAYLPLSGMIPPYFLSDGKEVSLVKDDYHDTVVNGVHHITVPTHVILWSQPLNATPFDFTFEAGKFDETLRDSSGQVIWSQTFDKPSFVLTSDKAGTSTLADESGHILWSGPLPRSEQGYLNNAGKEAPAPYEGGYRTDIFTYLYGPNQVALQNVDGQTLWTGKSERNGGLQIGDFSSSERPLITGIPSIFLLPINEPLHIRVTCEDVTVTVSNALRRPIAAFPYQLMKTTLLSDDARFQDKMTAARHGLAWLGDELPAYPDIKFAPKPAVYYVNYQDASGRFIYRQKYRVTQVTPEEAYSHLTPAQAAMLARQNTFYQVVVADNVDANGDHSTYPRPCGFLEVPKRPAPGVATKQPNAKL